MNPAEAVPISAIEHYEYCARQSALILVDGIWNDNVHTARGDEGHRRADSGMHRVERGRIVLRSVPLWSEIHNLTGRADVVEVDQETGTFFPVEYKTGQRHGMTADLQLCAEALCLEEMTGTAVPAGAIWYGGTRHRRRVVFDLGLTARTLAVVASIQALLDAQQLPDAPNDARCSSCQLLDHCLPDVVSAGSALDHYVSSLFDVGPSR